jgi:signal transduction histidine kinase
MPISSRFFVQSTTALLLVGFLARLGIVGMTFWLGERAQVYFNEVIAARDARSAAVDLRNALQTAESSQRGFLYTGNEVYLASYGPAKTLAERRLAAVNRLLASYGGASASVPRLTAVINEKFAEMDLTIAMKRDYRDADALARIRTNRGKALMDEANVFFAGIISATDERLTTVVAEQKANAILLRLFSIISGIVIVIVIGTAAVTVVRYTRELRRARTEVSVLNAGLEQRVEARTADLQRANADIQRFVQIISHDLRAPLVSIVGFTAELEDSLASLRLLVDRSSAKTSADDPDLQEARAAATELLPEAIGYIRSSSDKMERLINAVLKLAREGRRPLKAETVDLREIVTAGAAAIQHQLSEADGKIDIDLGVPRIESDRFSLDLILGNLLDNAVKYRAKDRPLHIKVRARPMADDRVEIEVADNGRGIAERDQERVFDLFKRSGTQDQPGDGIGLAHVLAAVRNLGGDISVASELGRGTTFRLTMPRALATSGTIAA